MNGTSALRVLTGLRTKPLFVLSSKHVLFLVFVATSAFAQEAPIRITADLSEAPRKLFHAEVDLPVTAGPLVLTTPRWIPGEHRPSGPVADITGVVFTVNGKTLPWRRDDVDLYEFHLTIPAGATSLHAHLDCITTSVTNNLAVLEWEQLLLYPAGIPVRGIPIQASVHVPAGWGIGTSLTPISQYDPQHPQGGLVHYAATTVEMLEDSPVMTGAYFHEYAFAPEITPRHYLDVFGDAAEDVELRPTVLDHLNRLIHEAKAMYGAPHYRSYHFLLALKGTSGGGGLEHHESSDNSLPERALTTDENEMASSDLLPHELTHSWNGKYRRPAGLATIDYATPMKDDLLWVYEGLTDYLGKVLATRCGSISPAHYREAIALDAATMDYTSGRVWRSTEDTAIVTSVFHGGSPWANWRRSSDYYPEGNLLWLDVDTTIRKLTGNEKNLRDFLAVFLDKGGSTTPTVVPYDFNEIVTDLNEVVKYDWAGFLNDRVKNITPHVDLEGIEQGGYKLVYTDKPSDYEKAIFSLHSGGAARDVWFSIGVALDPDGTISDVRVGGPADKAKFIPGERIIAVGEKVYSKDALHAAIRQSKTGSTPLHFILQNDTLVTQVDLDYHDGERYPTLVRSEGTAAYLDDIAKPLVKTPVSSLRLPRQKAVALAITQDRQCGQLPEEQKPLCVRKVAESRVTPRYVVLFGTFGREWQLEARSN
jgi:predicted metalloprotease with PDZ domain